jgi:hypothetical protein
MFANWIGRDKSHADDKCSSVVALAYPEEAKKALKI